MRNYHTHTERCKHAVGNVKDYVEEAIRQGVEVLGMSDHVPFPDNRWSEVRMSIEELDDYCKEIEEAKENYSKIKILKGLECEYLKEYGGYYQEELLEKRGMDYLILAGHEFINNSPWNLQGQSRTVQKELKYYTEYLVRGMETGLFSFVAHPDVFGLFYLNWDEECIACARYISEAAEAFKMPLEINGYGLRKSKIQTPQGTRQPYPIEKFWEIASNYNIRVIANSDAHQPSDIIANIEEAYKISERYGLKRENLFDENN